MTRRSRVLAAALCALLALAAGAPARADINTPDITNWADNLPTPPPQPPFELQALEPFLHYSTATASVHGTPSVIFKNGRRVGCTLSREEVDLIPATEYTRWMTLTYFQRTRSVNGFAGFYDKIVPGLPAFLSIGKSSILLQGTCSGGSFVAEHVPPGTYFVIASTEAFRFVGGGTAFGPGLLTNGTLGTVPVGTTASYDQPTDAYVVAGQVVVGTAPGTYEADHFVVISHYKERR